MSARPHGPGLRRDAMRIPRGISTTTIRAYKPKNPFSSWLLLVFGYLLVVGLGQDKKPNNPFWPCSPFTSVLAFFDTTPVSSKTKVRRLYTPKEDSRHHLKATFFDRNENSESRQYYQPQQQQQQPTSYTQQGQPQQPFYSQTALTPLKVMLFVDGTWLYYSIYEREYERDILAQRYGKDWKNHFLIDWPVIPMVACRALLEDKKSSWSAIISPNPPTTTTSATTTAANRVQSSSPQSFQSQSQFQPQPTRPVEISRVSVYSSMRKDTDPTTFRYKMFSDMADSGFDVNMMESIGGGGREKCVDIQLAVDMLYYATVPDAYDVALILTGDKDFLPAIKRCRQKGRRIALVSMRSAVSQAFTETPNLLDYNTIWIEDYLDEWVREMTLKQKQNTRPANYEKRRGVRSYQQDRSSSQPPRSLGGVRRRGNISPYVMKRVVADFITDSGESAVSIRDIGREIKGLSVNNVEMLNEVKDIFGGLYQFLVLSEIFEVRGNAGQFFASFDGDEQQVESRLQEEMNDAKLTEDEVTFLKEYKERTKEERRITYSFTLSQTHLREDSTSNHRISTTKDAVDYEKLKVPELKDKCRELGIAVSGRKAELIERLQSYSKEHRETFEGRAAHEESDPKKRLELLVIEYLQAKGGRASSRDIGRYLAANSASHSHRNDPERSPGYSTSALSEMKDLFGSVKNFISQIDYLTITFDLSGERLGGEFDVILPNEWKESTKEMLSSSMS